MFDNLVSKIDGAVRTLQGKNRITEINVATTVKEIRRALVDADVNYKVAKEVTDRIKEEALGKKVFIKVNPGELLTKIVQDELTALMGGEKESINIKGNPAVILLAGLQGSGKTTFSGKLANYLKKQNKNVLLVACDIYRPAAIEQLKVLGENIGVEVYAEPENKDAVSIAKNALKYAKDNQKNLVIVDTAGRLSIDEDMMTEIGNVKKAINPNEILFVVDSMTGQDAVNTAKNFNDRLDFDGVVLTKLDGDTRGGAALSIKAVVNKPIKFNSKGEKMDDIEEFYPESMARRILDKGDTVRLVEEMEKLFDEEESKKLEARLRRNQFDFNDFLSQIQQIKKMGDLKEVARMIPGMGKKIKDADISADNFKPLEAIIKSMTPQEREKPDLIQREKNRRNRIAKGSGTSPQDVNNLIKQFDQIRKAMKKVNQMQKKGKGINFNPFG